MSKERNYRSHIAKYYPDGITDDGKVDHEALIKALELHHLSPDELTQLGESRVRAMISAKLGELEERLHGTSIDEESKKRIRPVPEAVTEHHNRLVDEVYNAIIPPEPPVAPKRAAKKTEAA